MTTPEPITEPGADPNAEAAAESDPVSGQGTPLSPDVLLTQDSPLEERLAAYAPTVQPPTLTGGDLRYLVEDTAIGRLLLAVRPDGALVACSFAPDSEREESLLERLARAISPRILRGGPSLDPVRRELQEYLTGRRRTFDLRIDLALVSPFQRTVLLELDHRVDYGSTTSYGNLARALGRPTAARAVGTALGANPLCVVLPCHRVLAASGALTGYAGGLAAKQFLLDLEAKPPTD